MGTKIVSAIVGITLVGLAGCGGDEERKASIGSGQGGKPSTPPGQAVSDDQAPDKGARGKSAEAPGAARAAAALQRRIERAVERAGNKDTFASYIDTSTNRIVLITDASSETIKEVTAVQDEEDKKEVGRAKVVTGVKTSDVWNRKDDIPAFWGGAGITQGGGVCSSGYAARTGSGAIVSVTAGHCFPNGANVLTESGARSYGTVSNRRLPTFNGGAMDVELVGGVSYAGRVYTGGLTSTSSSRVVAAGAASAGYSDYCHSGRTTGQSCGHTATSTNGQVCTQTGCKSPVIVFTGGNMIQGGDSGGTFYSKNSAGDVFIRGNTIASGGGTGYAQPWTTIAPALGLSIVTG